MAPSAQPLFKEQPSNTLYANLESTNKTSSIITFAPDSDSFYYHSTAFYYKNRARLHFNVTNEYLAHFGLVRGLIEFIRPSQLKFNYPYSQKKMEIDLDIDQFEELHQLFRAVHVELLKELRFKNELKKAIEFEQKYRREVAELYLAVG